MGTSRSASLPEKLAIQEKNNDHSSRCVRRFKTAVDPLYAGLSDQQKKTADQIMLMGPTGMMGMM